MLKSLLCAMVIMAMPLAARAQSTAGPAGSIGSVTLTGQEAMAVATYLAQAEPVRLLQILEAARQRSERPQPPPMPSPPAVPPAAAEGGDK